MTPRARYTAEYLDKFDLTPFERCVAVLLALMASDPSGEGEAWTSGGEWAVSTISGFLGVPETRVRAALEALEGRHRMLRRCTWESGKIDYVIAGYDGRLL